MKAIFVVVLGDGISLTKFRNMAILRLNWRESGNSKKNIVQLIYRISQYYSYEKSAIFGVDHRSIQKTEGGITQLFICTQLFISWGPGIFDNL